jgi:hypothetical protein
MTPSGDDQGHGRVRRRFGRTLSRGRWDEYKHLLSIAVAHGYAIPALTDWLTEPSTDAPILLIRHDVDQHPGSALRMAAIEQGAGVRTTWYFRWRTASAPVVDAIRSAGHVVGLHYETLTRLMLERGVAVTDGEMLIPEARETLARELALFDSRFGPVRSACPHGDSRVPGVHNGILLRGEDLSRYGIEWDVNDAVARQGVDVWLSDRSRVDGGWRDRVDPIDLILDRRSPVLAVIHPNNWVSGPGLWCDRILPGARRTGADDPEVSASDPARDITVA